MKDSGVSWYTKGIAQLDVYFPEGKTNCRYCTFCKCNKDFNTFKCMLTEEYILKENLSQRGRLYPITFDKGE